MKGSGDFDIWSEKKKQIDSADASGIFPQKSEVWMCFLGKNVGFEQNGVGVDFSRPVLVVKKFNNKMFWVAPLSTKQKAFDFYHNFTDSTGEKVSVILAQLRLMSVKRFVRLMYVLPTDEFSLVREKLATFLQ